MGSSNSSNSSDLDKFGEWIELSDCDCDDTKKRVYLIILKDVPMMSKGAEVGANIGRCLAGIVSFGATEAIAFKGHRLTHDVIEAHIRCECKGCWNNGCWSTKAKNNKECWENKYEKMIQLLSVENDPIVLQESIKL